MCKRLYLFLFIFLSISQIYGVESDNKNQKPKKNKSDETKEEKQIPITKDAEKPKDEVQPPRMGNFSLPISQQPAALFGFGGNIIEKGQTQLYLFADEFVGHNRLITDVIPGILFGITDELSIFFNFPFTPIMKDKPRRSSGLEDFFVQLEYSFYEKKTYKYEDQATVVTNITVPTGSVKKIPPTGFGSPSLFIGGTYYRTYVDWFLFTEQGAVLTTSEHGTKIGEEFLYQIGFGRNFLTPPGLIYAWMIELDGQYNKKNRIRGTIDPNSGGNYVYVTPSLWISSKEFLLQVGVTIPINQNLFGNQRKIDYGFNFNLAWSFY